MSLDEVWPLQSFAWNLHIRLQNSSQKRFGGNSDTASMVRPHTPNRITVRAKDAFV
jgi:hypothetical protein